MLRPGFPRLSHPEVAHAIPSVGFMAQVYRRVRLLVSPTIVGVQLTDQQRTAQAPEYDRAFVRRGDVTLWLTPDAIATWAAAGVGRRSGPLQYSDLAIETVLTLSLIFH